MSEKIRFCQIKGGPVIVGYTRCLSSYVPEEDEVVPQVPRERHITQGAFGWKCEEDGCIYHLAYRLRG